MLYTFVAVFYETCALIWPWRPVIGSTRMILRPQLPAQTPISPAPNYRYQITNKNKRLALPAAARASVLAN
ncbi:hypothetical protein EVAR_50869_1 [Eumeta japonica]|uniref:Uncharacterized protein n=1 Tax=Eumeta variegata TaxID=151549 RepID=A0A4C1Y5Z8_EUMVA|nr:hypothetical protein EVAR_50869_1 [Eumeta japonica]